VTVFAKTTLLICVIAVAVASASGGTAYAQNKSSKKHPASSTMTRLTLRVSTCPASYGYVGQEVGDVPTSASVTLPRVMKHDFALYTDSKRTMAPLLAPRGWRCNVQVGGNGSTVFSLYPTKKAPPQSNYSNAEEIVATTSGGCQSCVADEVCPYFVNALTQIGYTGMPCNTSKPSDELDDYVAGSSASNHGQVDTYTPPTKKNRYGAYGVLRYLLEAQGNAEDAREICVLPHDESSWCQAAIKEFVAENWEFRSLPPSESAPSTTTVPSSLPDEAVGSPPTTTTTTTIPSSIPVVAPTTTTTLAQCPSGSVYSSITITNAPTGIYPPNEITTSGTLTNNSGTTIYVSELGFNAEYSDGSSGEVQVAIGQEISSGGSTSWTTSGAATYSETSAVINGINATYGAYGDPCPVTWVPDPQ